MEDKHGIFNFYILAVFYHLGNVRKVFSRRTAAVIADAPTRLRHFGIVFLSVDIFLNFFGGFTEVGIVLGYTTCLYSAAVITFPNEIFCRQFKLIPHIFPVRTHKHIRILTAFSQYLYESP